MGRKRPSRRVTLLLAGALVAVIGATRTFAHELPVGFSETTIPGTWSQPVGLTFAADGRMFVWEKAGRVWIVEDGVQLSEPLLDIHDEVGNWMDHGMLGFVLDPISSATATST